MANPTPDSATTLHLRRTFAASREKVFQAWTQPAALREWFSPEGYAAPSAEVDLRVGGRYRIGMRKLPDGDVFYLGGTYREVRSPERLVYTWQWEGEHEQGESLVTVEFRDLGDSTEVVVTHERFPTIAVRQEHEQGWQSCLGRLSKTL